ncbi:LysR family transcriptional regulator [Caballeronia grimmiae]|uniref:LysR family transcriptional regulator n=1 Tax=Caballeronia grimmiae TaxID=1071679 RepID=A0A069NDK1_9BURK|nr:LysR family transcriptional regulator [Caballeronia grimmiae]KDR26152.1 LysR family transcriptional regulator [Caballeronia grimmiae]GGD97822.1 LysR family transcriptional regulator [Caballeronia grimmiae]
MDRFQELTAFVAVVEAGGFSAAARRIGDSQSAISKSVSALENRLGVQLLKRSTRSVTLTDQGRTYYERTRPLLDEIAQADGELMNSTLELSGLVRIATSATFGRLHVLPLIPELLARHPKLRLDVILSDGVQDLLADGIDLAIRINPVSSPDAVVKRVTTMPLVCVGSRRYFEKHGTPLTPDDLATHNCIVFHGVENWVFEGPRGKFNVRVNGNLSTNTVETILSAIRAGVGIGMFHRASLTDDLRSADVVAVLEEYIGETRDVSLVWPNRKFISARVRQVTEFFATALGERL